MQNATLTTHPTRIALLSMLALGVACGDDTTATPDPTTSGGSTSTTTDTPTTTSPTTETSSSTGMGAESSSTGDEASSTGDPSETGTAGSSSTTSDDGSSTTDASSSSTTTGEGESSTGTMAQECPYGDLMVPDVVNANTVAEDSEFTSTCGGGGAPDTSYTLTAPEAGIYVFRASSPGGAVDPILAVFDGVCGGPELACNNNASDSTQDAEISVELMAGQTVTVVVDGFALAGGPVDLSVAYFSGTCPDGDLGNMAPVNFMGDTTMSDNTFFGSCGGDTAADDSFTYVAPEAGIYTIDTEGSAFDTILYVRDACTGTEIACNDNGGTAGASRVNVTLEEAEEITVFVDGGGLEAGAFNVNIELDTCPDIDLGSTVGAMVGTGNNESEINASTGSCGGGSGLDVAYTFTAPAAGAYVIDTNGTSYDTVLYVFDGATCEGTSLECDDDGGDGTQSELVVNLAQDQEITIVVDGYSAASTGDYVLNIAQIICGNGTVEIGEECDGAALDGEDCVSLGNAGGTLGCNADCTFDQTMCDTCGNGTVEGADQCDGNALGAQTCADQGFTGGALDCGNDCTFDTAQCSNDVIAICSTPGSGIDSGNPTTTDTITVPNMGNIADVDVFLDITHTYDGDLDISLSADGLGVSNDLVQDQCGTSEDVWAVFNDEGSAAPADNCDEPYGIEGNLTPLTALSAYDGMEASGEWTLSVTDDAGGDSGTLNEWCLYLTLE